MSAGRCLQNPSNTPVEFNDNWERVLTSTTKDSELYIQGDFNCDTLTKKGQQSKLIRTTKDNQLHQMIKEPTRVTDHSSTCVDLVFVNHIDKVIDSNAIKTATSNHYMVYLTRRTQRSRPKTPKRVRMRCLKNYTQQNFLDCLWKHPWRC